VTASDHAEGICGREIGRLRQRRDGLLASIDQIGVLFAFIRKRAHAEHTVLGLKRDLHPLWNVVRHQSRNADAEIDVETVAQFLGGALCKLFAGPGHQAFSRLRVVRCSIRFSKLPCTMRSTKMPGVWIAFGSSSPASTRISTSATHLFPTVAIIGLKLRAVS